MASAGLWITYTTTVGHFEAQLVERGELLADSLNHSAMVAGGSAQVQHVVDELSRSPLINQIIVVTSEPPEVIASSNSAWSGMRIDQLPDRHLSEHILKSLSQGIFGHHFDDAGETLMLTTPLEPHIVDHQGHVASMAPGSAAPEPGKMRDHGMAQGLEPGASHGMEPAAARDRLPFRGAIMLYLDGHETSAASSQILWLLCATIITAVLIIMSIAYVLVERQILARLNLIRRAMTEKKSGDGPTWIPIVANDEIGYLGRAFNEMIEKIDTETKMREGVVKDLRDSEERFQSFAEIGSDWMWEMDANLRFSYFSDAVHKMTGLPRERYLGKTRTEVGQGMADDPKWQRHLEDLAAHRQFRDFCYTIDLADGSTGHWSISGTPIFDSSGEFEGYRGIGSDITERKAAEQAMLTATKEAEIANRTKSEFLANMSHELRTPLNAIIGFSDIIRGERLGSVGNDKYRDYADDINESGHHLLSLINNILDLSKIEFGTNDLLEENIDIPEISKTIVKSVMELARTGDVELELDVSNDIPLLRADARKVKQILLNLLSNAIKFTPSGGKVTLRIWSGTETGFVFQVTDTGIGIATEDIQLAMAPFQQIDSGLNRKHEGTGLGLPLAKSLVEMHGGYLDLQSEVDVGTTVTMYIPAERIVHAPLDATSMDSASKKAG